MIWDDDDCYAMHFGLTDYEIFWAAWAEVWRERRIALPLPRIIMPSPAHGPAALGRRYWKPVIRSWLGGPRSDPLTV